MLPQWASDEWVGNNEDLLACVFPIKADVITNTDVCLIYEYQIFTLNIQYGTIPWRDYSLAL